MKVKMITPSSREYYKELILPQVYKSMEDKMPITALGLSDKNKAVGALAGLIVEGNVFEVLSIYVDKEYRRCGGGTMLVRTLQDLLEEPDIPAVLSCLESEGENDTVIALMESIGAARDTQLEGFYRGKPESIWESGLFNRDYKNPDIKRFSQLNKIELEDAMKVISKFKVPLDDNYFSSGGILRNVSLALIKNGTVQGVMLFCGDGSSEPIVLLSSLDDPVDKAAIINSGLIICEEELGADAYVRIPVWSERYNKLLQSIEGMTDLQHNYIF